MACLVQDAPDAALVSLHDQAALMGGEMSALLLWIMARIADALLYRGDSRAAWQCVESFWPRYVACSSTPAVRSSTSRVVSQKYGSRRGAKPLRAARVRGVRKSLARCERRARTKKCRAPGRIRCARTTSELKASRCSAYRRLREESGWRARRTEWALNVRNAQLRKHGGFASGDFAIRRWS